MVKRFASVCDALPHGLRNTTMMQSDTDVEAAMFDAAQTLAEQKGYHLVHIATGYILSATGVVRRFGLIEDAARYIRNATKTAHEPLAGSLPAVGLDLPENATKAIYWAVPIATINWTDISENATCVRCTNQAEVSNE